MATRSFNPAGKRNEINYETIAIDMIGWGQLGFLQIVEEDGGTSRISGLTSEQRSLAIRPCSLPFLPFVLYDSGFFMI